MTSSVVNTNNSSVRTCATKLNNLGNNHLPANIKIPTTKTPLTNASNKAMVIDDSDSSANIGIIINKGTTATSWKSKTATDICPDLRFIAPLSLN